MRQTYITCLVPAFHHRFKWSAFNTLRTGGHVPAPHRATWRAMGLLRFRRENQTGRLVIRSLNSKHRLVLRSSTGVPLQVWSGSCSMSREPDWRRQNVPSRMIV